MSSSIANSSSRSSSISKEFFAIELSCRGRPALELDPRRVRPVRPPLRFSAYKDDVFPLSRRCLDVYIAALQQIIFDAAIPFSKERPVSGLEGLKCKKADNITPQRGVFVQGVIVLLRPPTQFCVFRH